MKDELIHATLLTHPENIILDTKDPFLFDSICVTFTGEAGALGRGEGGRRRGDRNVPCIGCGADSFAAWLHVLKLFRCFSETSESPCT